MISLENLPDDYEPPSVYSMLVSEPTYLTSIRRQWNIGRSIIGGIIMSGMKDHDM